LFKWFEKQSQEDPCQENAKSVKTLKFEEAGGIVFKQKPLGTIFAFSGGQFSRLPSLWTTENVFAALPYALLCA
jgi:hypothetical protein